MSTFIFVCIYFMPILAIIFCLNLVEILKKIKRDQPTARNTFFLTISFVFMIWSIAVAASLDA
ncbi:hypothetical protein MUG87_18810 [Ectobacillus sp. JY-23]|uniref:hypothetical protein n=1 Tax=Ectobacillus sp. JY-23 TaxID=2933872 RepID=UPI001FF47A4C|nr:hypothetical protein [Ectobacillus sp. JY-23]UOY92442.1 hypothetical protein MUG87_18810 [Ectobacillus sp. JY-23]